jgi:apolipoprotein N-acyltransferase
VVHRSSFLVHRFVLAILSGLLLAFAFPNVAIGWLIFVAPIPLFIALAFSRGGWQSFFLGWISMTTAWLLMVPWVDSRGLTAG